jgi:hypothetical protein
MVTAVDVPCTLTDSMIVAPESGMNMGRSSFVRNKLAAVRANQHGKVSA